MRPNKDSEASFGAWHTAELIPKAFTVQEVEPKRSRIEPMHARKGDLVAFPIYGSSFAAPVFHAEGGWIGVDKTLYWTQAYEEWCVPYYEPDPELAALPYDSVIPGEFGEWRRRELPFPIHHVRNIVPGIEGLIVGPMYSENTRLQGELSE
jgi:hypothetical protein